MNWEMGVKEGTRTRDLVSVSRCINWLCVGICAGCITMIAFMNGCASSSTPAVSANEQSAQQVARETVQALDQAWNLAADACVATAKLESNDSIRQGCVKVLVPVHTSIVLAATAVDGWSAADQSNLPCLMQDVYQGFTTAATLVPFGSQVTSEVNLAAKYVPACVLADAGTSPAPADAQVSQ